MFGGVYGALAVNLGWSRSSAADRISPVGVNNTATI